MTAVDTNVIVRLLTYDDIKQATQASSIFATEEVWIAKTVLLETVWVLSSLYGFGEKNVRGAIALLLGLPNVRMEDRAAVDQALSLVDHGLEFADALHLASAPDGARFVSFDRAFIRRSRRAGVPGVSDR